MKETHTHAVLGSQRGICTVHLYHKLLCSLLDGTQPPSMVFTICLLSPFCIRVVLTLDTAVPRHLGPFLTVIMGNLVTQSFVFVLHDEGHTSY